MLQKSHFNVTIDGQFGSTGKGLLNDYIAKNSPVKPDICVSNAAPNAGHTYVDANGAKRTVFHLPVSGVLLPDTLIYLCAGSIIDPDVLAQELSDFEIDPSRVAIHPRACIVLPEHRLREGLSDSGATAIASTRKGVGAALADKVARIPGTRTAEQYYGAEGSMVKEIDLMEAMDKRKTVLAEIPQGFGLSINHGRSYPHCTSRDITVSSALNDAGVHPKYLGSTAVSLRTFPIRVGNIVENGEQLGSSGPFYHDSDEKSWEDLGQEPELTTVTKRVRRIATFSYVQYKLLMKHLRPDTVFLNFANYLSDLHDLKEMIVRMSLIDDQLGMRPKYLIGAGPAASDVTELLNAEQGWNFIKERK